MDYTLSATNITDISFDIIITANVATTGTRTLALKVEDASAPGTGTSFMLTDTGMAQGGTKTFSVGGSGGAGIVIDANTEYDISLKVNDAAVADPITVTTKATGYDTPRTATQEQWEDLADRVNVRPIISSSITPPISVEFVGTNNISNGAVTPTKIDMASLIDVLYPVGCYFETSDTTFDPNVSWGGTWVEDSAGKVTVSQDTNDTSFDVIGETGGLKQTNHVFYRPPINTARAQDAGQTYLNHVQNFVNAWLQSGGSSSLTSSQSVAAVGGEVRSDGQINTEAGFFKYTSTNLQPYITVKRWHRTA